VIRINLLGNVPKVARPWVPANQKSAIAGLAMLALTATGVGGWWWQVAHARADVDRQIAQSEIELTRMKNVSLMVEQAVAQKLELTERLGLIDRLHRTQRAPVELLQTVSRSVPDGLWLLELKQQGNAIQIEGRASSLTSLADFVERLQTSGRFEHPVDIVTTNMETVQDQSVVRFALKAAAK
jgi:Tfp pilus assembly protein PilN